MDYMFTLISNFFLWVFFVGKIHHTSLLGLLPTNIIKYDCVPSQRIGTVLVNFIGINMWYYLNHYLKMYYVNTG